MSIRTILVQAGSDARAEVRLNVALSLAAKFDAHVTALHVIPTPIIPTGYADFIPAGVIEQEIGRLKDVAAEAKQAAMKIADRAGRNVEWRESGGPQISNLIEQGYYSDLVVVDQKGPMDEGLPGTMVLAAPLALGVGRPVFCVPYVGNFPSLGKRVMIAWNGSREATRAAHDALPFLKKAEQVIVFSVNPASRTHYPGADMATHLARHGVKVEAKHTVARDVGVGDALLGALSDFGTDLLVMGAYGHSRMRELAFGGATRSILETMTVPVLLSH